MLYQKGTFSGNHGGTGFPSAFANVIALEFGGSYGEDQPGKINEAIAAYLVSNCVQRFDERDPEKRQCFYVTASIHTALTKLKFDGMLIDSMDDDYAAEHKCDAYDHISEAAKVILAMGKDKSCLIVTHTNLAGRAMKHAERCGLDPHVPWNTPGEFDAESPTVWCRNRFFWSLHEIAAQPWFKLTGKM